MDSELKRKRNCSARTKGPPARRVEIFTGAGRRRSWSAAEKARIVAESLSPGASVSAVARRHGLMSSQIFRWRRMHGAVNPAPAALSFAPVVVGDKTAASAVPASEAIEVEFEGVRLRIPGGTQPAVPAKAGIMALLKALRPKR
ncbi:MAG: IS66-like element accessory protein TnpA [Bryobacteraceae bacterium]